MSVGKGLTGLDLYCLRTECILGLFLLYMYECTLLNFFFNNENWKLIN